MNKILRCKKAFQLIEEYEKLIKLLNTTPEQDKRLLNIRKESKVNSLLLDLIKDVDNEANIGFEEINYLVPGKHK